MNKANAGNAPQRTDVINDAAWRIVHALEGNDLVGRNRIREAMTAAAGASDEEGGWSWHDAYEAMECAHVRFICRHGAKMRQHACKARDPVGTLTALVSNLAGTGPTHTHRDTTQVQMQQFSTPLEMGLAVAFAARLRPEDTIVEPSAGTGLLAVCALHLMTASEPGLALNEAAKTRAELLKRTFEHLRVTTHDALELRDREPTLRPSVVVMNPPFSRRLRSERRRRGTDLDHIAAAVSSLSEKGRCVAITAARRPAREWRARLEGHARVSYTIVLPGAMYARHGTNFETRITVLEQTSGGWDDTWDAALNAHTPQVTSAAEMVGRIVRDVPPRNADAATPPPLPAGPRRAKPAKPAEPVDGASQGSTPAKQAGPKGRTTPVRGRWGTAVPLHYDLAQAKLDSSDVAKERKEENYVAWRARTITIPGAAPHPTGLVESAAMAAVNHRIPSYRPLLPPELVTNGILSDAQFESVVLAGDALEEHFTPHYRIRTTFEGAVHEPREGDPATGVHELGVANKEVTYDLGAPVQFRRGWMLGDGTGCGKGRQIAALILDQWMRGRRKAVWLSQSGHLVTDARRDWRDLGGDERQVIELREISPKGRIEHEEGILFVTYATLRMGPSAERVARLDQIVAWLADIDEPTRVHAKDTSAKLAEFEGCIVFDESHAMAGAAGRDTERGRTQGSAQGRAGISLQLALPNARILYASATGATTVEGLCYALRLGLWGMGETAFKTVDEMMTTMTEGGMAALEIIARDLKALGLYSSRALSYEGCEIEPLMHELTSEQVDIYNAYADAFVIIHRNLSEALKAAGVEDSNGKVLARQTKAYAMSRFESEKQRFFGHLLCSMKCPTLITAMEDDLREGRSAVIQLVSTGEALMDRRLAIERPEDLNDLDVDPTPREYVMDYLASAFPTQAYAESTDESGNPIAVPMYDDNGNAIQSAVAVALRDELLRTLGALPPVPGALDQIVQYFGTDQVAEVSGRSRRIVRKDGPDGPRLALESRSAKASRAEINAFMDDLKRILIFSMAGAHGVGYHAAMTATNQRRRHHYVVEAGWRADQAIQGFGRSHRTHQASAPVLRPVATNTKGEKRFSATIASRLDSLGAVTRGQRGAHSEGGAAGGAIFGDAADMEGRYAKEALIALYHKLMEGEIAGWSLNRFEEMTGLKLSAGDSDQRRSELPPIRRFLNRLLALRIEDQNTLFEELESGIRRQREIATAQGTDDRGVATLHSHSIIVGRRTTIATHPATHAKTELVEITVRHPTRYVDAKTVLQEVAHHDPKGVSLSVNELSGRAAVCIDSWTAVGEQGKIEKTYKLVHPTRNTRLTASELRQSHWIEASKKKWRTAWTRETDNLPEFTENTLWVVAGLTIKVWGSITTRKLRVHRIVADDGTTLIGLTITTAEAITLATGLGTVMPGMSEAEALHETIRCGKSTINLNMGGGPPATLKRALVQSRARVEVQKTPANEVETLRRMGAIVEIIAWRTRCFIPDAEILAKVLATWPATRNDDRDVA